MKFLSVTLFIAGAVVLGDATCIVKTLQEVIDYSRISGLWHQFRYTGGTKYEELKCYNLNIYNVNTETKTLHMESKFKPLGYKKGLSHSAFFVFDTMANWGSREEGAEFIGDHLATDYDNYLIMYQCSDEGQAIVDVELKAGVASLSDDKVKEVSGLLAEIGADYSSLDEVDQSVCQYPK